MSGLPTIAYRTDGGEQRRVRYARDDDDPSRVRRIVETRPAGGEWRVIGSEQLAELVVNEEHQMPRGVMR